MKRSKAFELRKLQNDSLTFVLIRCGQLLNDRGMARVNAEAGKPLMRESHTRLIPHLRAPEGIRVTELARKVGITKQAVHQLVADMLKLGILRIEADPDDARARRVSLTEAGLAALIQGTQQLVEIDREIAAQIGKTDVKTLHRLLSQLLGHLGEPPGFNTSS